ncbi:MAG: DUF3277 family protein [Deltaproteobacteria bacterium]|nr:DUF3277 family protein [Deltaproteobacteria bacterium]
MSAYSFLDVVATITGVGGSVNLAADAGVAEEGISIEPVNDKSTMTIGADGRGMHSLSADRSATVTIRLLKTSSTNAKLQQMYNLQTASSAAHGSNSITVRDTARGDSHNLEGVAFKKQPAVSYAKEAEMLEWTFDAIKWTPGLGSGTPALL